MRIFYAAGASPNAYFISESTLWEKNLFNSLIEIGHEVITFSKDVTWHFTRYRNYKTSSSERKMFLKYKKELQLELIREISAKHKKKKIDLFFSYFWSEICDPETIETIKSMGIKTVNWFCNGSYQLHLVKEIAPHYDWCLVPEKFRLKDYIDMGARPIYCQEAANPKIYKPYNLPVEFDVTFVGQAYGDRPAYIKYLFNQGIDIRVWGPGWERFSRVVKIDTRPNLLTLSLHIGRKLLAHDGWKTISGRINRATQKKTSEHYSSSMDTNKEVQLPASITHGHLSDLEMIQMFSRSKINLGFSTCGNTHETGERIVQVRLRDFEVPMSGGFYMVEYMKELEEFYEIGKEIVCYDGPKDLAEKIKYYLSNDNAREAIRKAGYERCLREHTWHKRFKKAFSEMGLN